MDKTFKKASVITLIIVLLVVLVVTLVKDNGTKEVIKDTDSSIRVWNSETASFVEYSSYEESEKERKALRAIELEDYSNATQGTIAEQLNDVEIPSYFNEDELVKLQNGEISIRTEKSDDFPEGVTLWYGSLLKNTNAFTVGDFNNDGLEDVAHVIGYTGGGSGYFYNLSLFINDGKELQYLTQISLGDRIVVNGIKYDSGLFTIDMITQGEGDEFMGYSFPNVTAITNFRLEGGNLIEVKE